ncbi:Ash-like/host cell division inhibitor Icd-like protein [Klebsiella pneumoniae]|nr:Ash-like/host cell division inhibitor Icd-like protein [Klebsiella pneumoniae]
MAGLMLPYSGFKNLAKISFPFAYKGNYFPHIAGGVNCIATSDSGAAWAFVNSTRELHHTCSNEFLESIKKGLMLDYIPVYGYSAPAKSGAGIGVLEKYKATHDAPSVFFCVLTFVHPFFSAAVIIRAARRVMVSWMGAEKSAPVTLYAGYANPVQLTTSEIGVSGGGIKSQYKEAAIMATTPTKNPQYIWIIAAVRREMPTIKPKIYHIAAPSEREARSYLVRDHVCFFAGRIRLTEVHHA